ncbi:MAG: shikimate dehydrogenase [Bacillota bacterium]|nr:MAG: shikimate dehydrogenase [Bacillota bacterium]
MMNLGLLGKNISYSKSPVLHQTIGQFLNIPLSYELFDVEEDAIPTYISMLRSGKLNGLNVTIPYKQLIMSHVDELTPSARKIQAVNCLYKKDGLIIGDNTDYDGFIGCLVRENIDVKNKTVCLLGSGGAAKACYVALTDLGAHVLVASRRKTTIDPLFKHVISYEKINSSQIELFINATPVGTYPNIHESIIPKEMVQTKTVIDLIYNPPKTRLLSFAQRGINGISMMIIQAIKSEEIWLSRKIKLSESLFNQLKEVIEHE